MSACCFRYRTIASSTRFGIPRSSARQSRNDTGGFCAQRHEQIICQLTGLAMLILWRIMLHNSSYVQTSTLRWQSVGSDYGDGTEHVVARAACTSMLMIRSNCFFPGPKSLKWLISAVTISTLDRARFLASRIMYSLWVFELLSPTTYSWTRLSTPVSFERQDAGRMTWLAHLAIWKFWCHE